VEEEEEPAMSEMVESTITSHTHVAHVPVPSQKEVNLHTEAVTSYMLYHTVAP